MENGTVKIAAGVRNDRSWEKSDEMVKPQT